MKKTIIITSLHLYIFTSLCASAQDFVKGADIGFLTMQEKGGQKFYDTQGRNIAFLTAEGYGKYTRGGRGGDVYEVTNLNDSGPGSLRWAVEAEGARTVVFRVSGTINLKSQLTIRNPYITIAGQTAPGDGICLRGYPLMIDADNVIVRYLRVRLGDETDTESDAISARFHSDIILDHVSASWSIDETVSIYHCENTTVQWCIISESLTRSKHSKGAHGYGGIWGGNHCTYHHNLLAHHSSRNPRFCGGAMLTDYRNNVIYNWGFNSCYGGGAKEKNRPEYSYTCVNMVNNYYKPGPATTPGRISRRIANPSWSEGEYGRWYIDGNMVEGAPDVTADNWLGVHPSDDNAVVDSLRMLRPWNSMSITQHSAGEAYNLVLRHAGASLHRDAVDERIVSNVTQGNATYGTGLINSQNEVGGWPLLRSETPLPDTDHDGMPDEWETAHGLNPTDPMDRNIIDTSGYTMLECYLNEIVK